MARAGVLALNLVLDDSLGMAPPCPGGRRSAGRGRLAGRARLAETWHDHGDYGRPCVSWSEIEWGTAAQWVSGSVAGIALILTTITIRSDRSARRRRDAELIYPLVEWNANAHRTEEGSVQHKIDITAYAYNGSPKPVFDITLAPARLGLAGEP